MGVEEEQRALVEPEAFPDAIAQDEAGIEDRNPGLVFRNQPAIQPDLEAGVAGIGGEVLASGLEFLPTLKSGPRSIDNQGCSPDACMLWRPVSYGVAPA